LLNASTPTSARSRASTWDAWPDSRTGSAAVAGSTSSPPRSKADVGILPSYPRPLLRRRPHRQRGSVGTRPRTPAHPVGSGAGFVVCWKAAALRSTSTTGCSSGLVCGEATTPLDTLAELFNGLWNEPARRGTAGHGRHHHRTLELSGGETAASLINQGAERVSRPHNSSQKAEPTWSPSSRQKMSLR
jgi:hypothetical protein